MKIVTNKVIEKIELPTINRGIKQFIISQGAKGYFAHEVGKLLEICHVIGGNECYAHRLNPSVRRGNQYGRYWREKPFTTINQAKQAITNRAETNVQYF